MDPLTYRILHLVGLLTLFLGLGASIALTKAESNTGRRAAMMLSGIGLIVVLVAGFGLKAKQGIEGWPLWLVLKILIWIGIGCLPVLCKRGVVTGFVAILAAIALGSAAVWLVLQKPFV